MAARRVNMPRWGDTGASSRVIYLHFLNRELFRSLHTRMQLAEALAAIDTLAIGSDCRFVSTIAFLWESGAILGPAARRMASLTRHGDLEIVSEFATPDEFVAACQRLYAFDRERYEIYFSPPKGVSLFAPTTVKDLSTTDFLDVNLTALGAEHVVPEIAPIAHADKVAVVSIADAVAQIARRREGRAVTLSLFQEMTTQSPVGVLALARLLSGLHLVHYLRFAGATIATGLPRLTYFDAFAGDFPQHDVWAISALLDAVGLHQQRRSEICEELEAWRHTGAHTLLVQTIQRLVRGLFYAPKEANGTMSRGAFADVLKHLVAEAAGEQWASHSEPVTLPMAADRLVFLSRIAARRQTFAEFVAKYGGTMEHEPNRLLVLTTTNIELDELIRAFAAEGHAYLRDFARDHTLYRFGVHRGVEVIAIQSEMGTDSPSGMMLTALDVVDAVHPDFMVLLGIGFGLKPGEQSIGDVMVSRQLRLFSPQKITMRNTREYTIPRGDRPSSAPLLLDRCKGARTEWGRSRVHFGLMWSTNVLVNSSRFVAKLKKLEPEAIGGEMEGAGVYCVGTKRRVDWIVIKAIADWGMGKTDEGQTLAASNAVAFLMLVLDQGGLQVRPI